MTPEQKERKRANALAWYHANKERVKLYQQENREAINKSHRDYVAKYKEERVEIDKKYYKNNKAKVAKRCSAYYKKRKKIILEQHRQYYAKNGNGNQAWRHDPKYYMWRQSVYDRDNYICQHCNKTNCMVHAHHIKEASKYHKLRYDIDNGVTLCAKCHRLHHLQK